MTNSLLCLQLEVSPLDLRTYLCHDSGTLKLVCTHVHHCQEMQTERSELQHSLDAMERYAKEIEPINAVRRGEGYDALDQNCNTVLMQWNVMQKKLNQ